MGIDTAAKKVQINKLVRSQVPSFVAEDNPLFVDFLKQYYISEESKGKSIDIITNFNDYQKADTYSENYNLIGFTTCTSLVNSYDATINVSSTDGWPDDYGLLKIDDEIITYTGITSTSFTGCVRGFSGVDNLKSPTNPESLVFSTSNASKHENTSKVVNLSNLFLQEFWEKTKELFMPGFEDRNLHAKVDKANFLRQAKDFYASKGTDEAIKILFGVLFDSRAEVIKPIEYLFAPSDADYVKTNDLIVERLSGNADNVVGQTLFQTDNTATSGSIFNVQYFPREGRNYYIISLSKGSIVGTFEPTGSSSLVNPVSIGTTVITVDSTLGFPEDGVVYVGAGLTVGIATYTSKSSTQFFGVSGISSSYTDSDFIRSSKTVFAYENGDVNKPVYFRLTNVASSADLSDVGFLKADDVIVPRQLGKVSDSSNYNLNSWVDNIKTKTDVARDIATNTSKVNSNSNVVTTAAPHLLSIDDSVVLLDITGDDQTPDNISGTVLDVYNDKEFRLVITSGQFDTSKLYKVQRQLNFAKSTNNQLGVEKFVADVQNTYISRDNTEVYVTAGSLPSYEIVATNRSKTFTSSAPEFNSNVDGVTDNITIVGHNFINGELVRYSPADTTLTFDANRVVGLDTGSIYAVKKVSDDVIQLSRSVPDVAADKVISIVGIGSTTTHELVPSDLAGKNVKHQNFLRKFPVTPEPSDVDRSLQNEPVGMFLNGVEILSNQSGDSVHFGRINHIDVESGGSGYDLITPPNIHISDNVGTGATAYAVIEADFKGIEVISGGYDIKTVPNVVITGGNGQGATASARLKATRNSRLFNAKDDVNIGNDRITFSSDHLFFDGESVVYEKSTLDAVVGGLVDKSIYFVNKVSDTQISLTNTFEDAVAGTNIINITGVSKGSHKFTSTVFRNVLDKIIVENPGSGYSNRKVLVNSTQHPPSSYFARDSVNNGINISNNYIYFKNHGFKSGETVEYNHTGTTIGGLHTTQNYQVIVLDENKFRVCSAGIGTTTTTVNYFKGRYVDLSSVGVGTHTFKYPDISVSLQTTSGVAVTATSAPVIRPLCHGSITDVYLTNDGVGYGSSDTLNAHRRPLVTVSNGQDALITLGITDGGITGAFVKIKGKGYVSPPELIVEGEGKYAKLLSNVASDGSLSTVNIIDSGKDYTEQPATTVRVKQQGSGAVFRADLTQWKTTTLKRYQSHINQNDDGIIVSSQNPEYEAKFASTYLPRKLRLKLDDNIFVDINGQLKENTTLSHSPIVGWAYDGAPIYGPYGHNTSTGGTIRRLISSYTVNLKSNRPSVSNFVLGSFIEDYDYTADGDLDKYNGRFCKTPEFPNGVYAYFCTIQDADGSLSPFIGSREPSFPYVLNGFKFKKVETNGQPLTLQDMPILNSGNILRNTLPYKLGFLSSDYDYLVSKNIDDTELLVKTIATSGIGSVNILSPGIDYKVRDRISFNNSESGGRGASAKVKTLVGKGVTEINYNTTTVDHIAFDFKNELGVGIASTCHGLQNNDLVNISGIGTGEMRFLEGPRTIGVASITSFLSVGISSVQLTGDSTFIKLTDVVGGKNKEDDIAVGDWLVIGDNEEKVKVLQIDTTLNRYRVLRQSGITTFHRAGQRLSIDQRRFTFSVGINTNLNVIRNQLVAFNPQNSIGVGTGLVSVANPVGSGNTNVVRVKSLNNTVLADHDTPPHTGQPGSNADNAISIPNHGLLSGQRLKYESGKGTPLVVSNAVGLGNSFALTDGQYVYAVKKSNDLLGITTTRTGIGSTSTSLYIVTIVNGNKEDHTFETTNEQHIGSLDRYDVIVHTSSGHELRTKDEITVDIAPNTLVNKTIEYDTTARKTIVDPKYVNSSAVSTTNSTITLVDHGYKDGDKILYSITAGATAITPLVDRGEYYVKRLSSNSFRLFDNRKDSVSIPNAFINITNIGAGVHRFARINPPIQALRGETIGFAVSDTSLADFKLEFYKDENFTNKFDGVGISTEIVRSGVSGASGSTVKVKLTDNIQLPLWYKLVPTTLDTIGVSKRDSEQDEQVVNGSKITIDPSIYAGNFGITTTGITSFTYQVGNKPEISSYKSSGITTFRYLTSSRNASGGINEISVDFPGVDYIKNPGINTIKTVSGRDADIRMFDDFIGRAGYKEIVKIGYDYPTDKSLSPRADTPVTVTVQNNFAIASIGIETAGKNYSTAPDIFFPVRPNAETEATLDGTGIGSVRIINDSLTAFDLFPNPPRIIAINNSNGVGIVTATSNGATQFLTIKSPLGGWRPEAHRLGTNFPFAVGDQIFVENVNIKGHPVIVDGEETFPEPVPSTDPRTYADNAIAGYNSNMYDFNFFTITARNITDSKIQYSLTGIGSTGGFFDSVNSAGRIIKKEDLPTFNVTFEHRNFVNGESVIFADGSTEGNIVKNEGWDPSTNSFRLENLTRTPYVGDTIIGKISKASGKVVESKFYEKYFTLGFNAEREKGWQKNTGKPSNDFQKLQDSDYYQNFSYSIQSEVQEKDFTDAVDSIVHPSGYKNFSDLVIKSTPTAGFGRSTSLIARSPQQSTDLKVDIDNVQSFFVKNDFDFATETTISNGLSKSINFQNRKLRNLLSVATAKVELMDDISNQFTGITTDPSGGQIVGVSSFRLTSQSGAVPLFNKIFNPNAPDSRHITVNSDTITIFNHGFQTGERIKYDNHGNTSVGIDATNHVISGSSTNLMPPELFVFSRLDNNRFKVAGLSTSTTAFNIRTLGTGTEHSFSTISPENKTIIQIDGMIQSPLTNRSVNLDLIDAVGVGSTTLKLQASANVGLTTVKLNDILQIDNEFFRVRTVGFGSTNAVSVDRGFLGSTVASHAANAVPQMKGGNFRIDKDVIFFATPPFGPTGPTGVSTQSTFSGRVFNRKDVTRNFVFDDISHKFTGSVATGKTFTLTQGGSDTTGIVTTTSGTGGSDEVINYGVFLINGIFQRPTVDYDIVARSTAPNIGVGASIIFTGDNLFDLPRGGKVDQVDPVTLGQNYQPRVRAGASAVVNPAGSIQSVSMLSAGSGYFSGSFNIEIQNPLGVGSTAILTATVGTGNSAGMITGITTVSGGTGYSTQFPPVIKVGIATGYTDLSVTGGSGSGLRVDALIGSGGTVIGFDISKRGFGYKNGEILTVQGIPFRVGVSTSPFTLTIKTTIDDQFAGFSFGQLVPLDDFSAEFNGAKKTFVLTKTILTKDVVSIISLDTSIDVTNNLLIFINDVLQQPGQNYSLEGGSILRFVEPPKGGSKLQVLFFRGGNQDIEALNPVKTVKVGDKLQLLQDLQVPNQSDRVVSEITEVSEVDTPPYGGGGISTNPSLVRVISWKKQEKDLVVDGLPIAKDRPLQVGNFYPSARLIRNVGTSSVTTYVDNAFPFFSAYDNRTDIDGIPGQVEIINTQEINVATGLATVSTGGKVTSITVTNGGSGYENIPTVSIANFNRLQSGIDSSRFETIPLTEEVGRTWNKITAPADISYNDIDYTPEGVFVAVGSTSGIHTSTDGNNWTVSTTGTFGTFKGVVGLSSEVVAVGGGGTIARSTNAASTFGITTIYSRKQVGFIPSYTPRNISQSLNAAAVGSYLFPNALTGIGTTVPHERVVVVGAAGTILYTEPGLAGLTSSFVISNKFATQDFHGVAYNDGTFVAVGNNGSIYRSTDGETWAGVTTTSITTNLKGIAYGSDKWIAVGAAGTIISSGDDGLNWSVVGAGGTFQLNGVHYQNNVWLAVGGAGMAMNSSDGSTWYKKHVVAAGTPLGAQLNAVTYGDNKMVAVGIQSSLVWSGYEKVGAAATATVGAGGTISAITVNEGGFGYTPNSNPTVLLGQEVVTREKCNTVNVTGDYGVVVGVAVSASGSNSRATLNLSLDADVFLNQAAFGNISKTGLVIGDYFVLKNSVFGTGVTSIDKDGNNVGVGTSFADNIYKVEEIVTSNTGIVTVFCNINSTTGITPITGSKLGDYSFGKLTNLTRSTTDPKVFNINSTNGYTGITTAPEVRRINPLAITYSDFDKTT